MNDQRAAVAESKCNRASEVFAAELTAAAYCAALRRGAGDKWLDLELDLWRVLTETVRKRKGIGHGDSIRPGN
jgi:hypothetical protein